MLTVRRARTDELHTCFAVRYEVFVLGQGVPPELEVDGHDPSCFHFIAHWRDELAGTTRLRITKEGTAKIERVAVRPPWQGRGVGTELVHAAENFAREQGYAEVMLSAQEKVVPFYARLGYEPVGERFMEACIPHRKMKRTL